MDSAVRDHAAAPADAPLPTSQYTPISPSEHARVIKTLSRAEANLLPDILPNGEMTAAAVTRAALQAERVNIYQPSPMRVKDDRIKAAINANPMSAVERVGNNDTTLPIVLRARRAAAARAGKMLDFCNRPRLGPKSVRSPQPDDVSMGGGASRPGSKIGTQAAVQGGASQEQSNSGKLKKKRKKKKKLSRSQLQGRARLSMDRGEVLLSKTTTPKLLARSKSIEFTPERIAEWFVDIPESDRLCSLSATKPSPKSQLFAPKLKGQRASLEARIRKDEKTFQRQYAAKRRREKNKSMKSGNKKKKTSKITSSISTHMPAQFFGVNPAMGGTAGGINSQHHQQQQKQQQLSDDQASFSTGKCFDAKSKVVVGFDTLRRGPNPKRVPPRLAAFWANQEKTGVGHKILSDGFTLSEFEVNPKNAYSDLPVSKEMQAIIKQRILGGANEVREGLDKIGKGGKLRRTQSMTNIWDDFWTDQVGSELAAPLTSAIFVSSGDSLLQDGETAAQNAPTFTVDDETATARLPHAGRRFQYAAHAHAAASRMQRIYHHRRSVRNFASTKISSCFRGYIVRRAIVERRHHRAAAALLIASLFRGRKARVHASFIRATGWNNVAIVCQRSIRRHLAKQELERRRNLRVFNAAMSIQRRVRGILGRVEAKQWKTYVRDRSARCIQNMVRYANFKDAFESYRFLMIMSTEDIQRLVRGHLGRKRGRHARHQFFAVADIQRVWRGFLGRRRFGRKMAVVRTASTVIQVRIRGIISRRIAAETRRERLEAEATRTAREEAACARKLATTRDFLFTKGGKNEYKKHRSEIIAEIRAEALSSANLTMGAQKRRLVSLKKAFQLVDFRCTGLVDRNQFEELLCGTLLIAMSPLQLDRAWAKTATVKANKGGYRLCDPADQRELSEIVPWFNSGQDRRVGMKASVGRVSLKMGRALSCKAGKTTRNAQNRVFHRTRLECITSFRSDVPPPFACAECTKRFVFSYELENHMRLGRGEGPSCPGKYFTPGLDD